MERNSETIVQPQPPLLRTWGLWGLLIGAVALVMVLFQTVTPTLTPQKSAATQVGEFAGEVKRSAWRRFLGLSPKKPLEVQPDRPPWQSYLPYLALAFGALAIVLSAISGVRREDWRFAAYGTTLGASAILFYYVWWMALLIVGALIIVAILNSIGDIFSFG